MRIGQGYDVHRLTEGRALILGGVKVPYEKGLLGHSDADVLIHAIMDAHRQGYAENMYLDPATRTNVEETGGANFIFITKDGKLVTPKSDSILPSITRRSLLYVAKHYLNMEVEERVVPLTEVPSFAEVGLCGTAAVISPVGKIVNHGEEICVPSGMDAMGPVLSKLYDTLTGTTHPIPHRAENGCA